MREYAYRRRQRRLAVAHNSSN